jgi:GDP-4-dehydro-6-deoxy-D-mannose reductase
MTAHDTTLVTGATGFAGGHLLDRLAERASLVGWYRPGGRPPDPSRLITWQPVNMLDAAGVLGAIAEIHPARVYHLAGTPQVDTSWREVVTQLKTNALGTHHLLDAVRQAGHPCRVLVVTSAQIYRPGDEPINEHAELLPQNPYGLSKLAADQLALRAAADDGMDVVVARPFNHAGPRQSPDFVISSFARQIALIEAGQAPPTIKVGNLAARRDITDVRDVVDAYERLMDDGTSGRPYNICSGRAWRMADLLDELLHLSTASVTVEVDQTRLRPSDALVLQGDASRMRAELGWIPRIQVEQTLRDTLDWWRRQVGGLSPPAERRD